MDLDLTLLVTLADVGGGRLLRYALFVQNGMNRFDLTCLREYDAKIALTLPLHVRSIGPIVDIEQIFGLGGVYLPQSP